MHEHDESFDCMGCRIRLLIGPALDPGAPAPAESARRAREWLHGFDLRLSRFRPDSELSELNADTRTEVPASPLLRAAVTAALWGAERTCGLADPTLLPELMTAGYRHTRAHATPAPLQDALVEAPQRRAGGPSAAAAWRSVEVDDRAEAIRRPPGLALDLGGSAKGLAADAVAGLLGHHSRFLVDCGGDLRAGGRAAAPFEVEVEHPLRPGRTHVLRMESGAVATSSLRRRIWRLPGGGHSHHLIDPRDGAPAWSGLIAATALADTALEADVLAKAALLAGPLRGRELLSARGGLLVHDSGRVELAGPLRGRPRLPADLREAA